MGEILYCKYVDGRYCRNAEFNRLRAEVEEIRRHHRLAVEQWTLEGQRVKELEDLLQQARHHCESEGDDTLVSLINNALRGEEE